MRLLLALGLFGLTTALTTAADVPAGGWKFRFVEGEQEVTFLLALTNTEGKWVGDFVTSKPGLKEEPKFTNLTVEGDLLRFGLAFAGKEFVTFEGRIAKDGSKITGTFNKFGGPLLFTELYPTMLKNLNDPIELAREDIRQIDAGPELFDLAFVIFEQAAAKKVPAEEIRSVVDRVTRSAGTYGPRWERYLALRMATSLAEQAGYGDIALTQARRAERMLPESAKPTETREVYMALARVLEQTGKAEEAQKYSALVAKQDEAEYAEFFKASVNFDRPEFAGRKGLSNRVVVLEQLTSCEVQFCAATEVALLGLSKTFKPSEVLVLSYHVPAGGMDAMSSQDGLERLSLYAEENKLNLEVPKVLINGVPGPEVAPKDGPKAATTAEMAKLWYNLYRTALEKELDKPAPVSLNLTSEKGEMGITVKAKVTDLEKPGEKIALRFVLVEQRIRFSGRNGLAFHENVVRALPGGVKGFPLTMKTAEQVITINVPKLKANQLEFLDEFTQRVQEAPLRIKPVDFNQLRVIALVQDNATGEILQAAQIELK